VSCKGRNIYNLSEIIKNSLDNIMAKRQGLN